MRGFSFIIIFGNYSNKCSFFFGVGVILEFYVNYLLRIFIIFCSDWFLFFFFSINFELDVKFMKRKERIIY